MWLHLSEVPREVTCIETVEWWLPEAGEVGKAELLFNRHRASVIQDENVWRLDIEQCEYA